jgi:hypothetical protein
LLWLGYEGEYAGLWETPWRRDWDARTQGGPSQGEVAEALIRLAGQGLIEVLAGPDFVDFDGAEVVNLSKLGKLLKEPHAWRSGEVGEFVVRYRTTDAGFGTYRKSIGWEDLNVDDD